MTDSANRLSNLIIHLIPRNRSFMVHPPATVIPPGVALQMLQKVQQRISTVELVYTAHERWPFRPGGHITNASPTLHVSVLDSSFNPPTLAHLALANSLPPSSSQHALSTSLALNEQYDARMLLLSVRNADKVFKPGDATFLQRLEMMRLLSRDIRPIRAAESSAEPSLTNGNVAVAIIDEPTFVSKSTVLLRFLRTRLATVVESSRHLPTVSDNVSHTVPSPRLTFLLGFDTLTRIFSPKYYPSEQDMLQMLRRFLSPDQEDSHIVCAYRRCLGSHETIQHEVLEVAHEFIRDERIAFINIGTQEQTYSSSEVRADVAARDEKWKRLVTHVIGDYIVERGLYSGSKERER